MFIFFKKNSWIDSYLRCIHISCPEDFTHILVESAGLWECDFGRLWQSLAEFAIIPWNLVESGGVCGISQIVLIWVCQSQGDYQ